MEVTKEINSMATVRNVQEKEVRTQWAGALASATQGGVLCPIPMS